MPHPIINISEIELKRPVFAPDGEASQRFDAKQGYIAPKIGAKLLGYNITEIPPGKRAFPLHNHRVNEEMFFILEGEGEVRIGKNQFPIKPGDFIACPPGNKDVAHQLINKGDKALKFLAVSTKLTPEVVEYPDSNKFGVLAEFKEGDDTKPRRFLHCNREENSMDYWDGE